MKNVLLSLVVLLSLIVNLYSQTTDYYICDTPDRSEEEMALLPWYGNNDTLPILAEEAMNIHDLAEYGNNSIQTTGEKSIVCDVESNIAIPLKFFFYQEVENDPAMPTESELQAMMDRINEDFQSNNVEVRFYMICTEIVTDADALNVDSSDDAYDKLRVDDNAPNAINIHVIIDYAGQRAGGAYLRSGDFIVVERCLSKSEKCGCHIP